MSQAVIDLNMLESEIKYAADSCSSMESEVEDDIFYNNLLYVRKAMCSQRKLFHMVLDVIRISIDNSTPVNSISKIFKEFMELYFKKEFIDPPLKVYRKSTKSWIPAIGKFADCWILEFGEDVIVCDKKDILIYEEYIKKFEK